MINQEQMDNNWTELMSIIDTHFDGEQKENILKNEKPMWLKSIEQFYENCDNHSIEYTLSHYKETFHNDFNDDYEILDIIGSGSIGQVYLIQDKPLTEFSKKEKYVMKILHPNVKYEIEFFRKFYSMIRYIPQVNKILNERFPFDIHNFILFQLIIISNLN